MRTTAVNKMASMNGDQGAAPAAAGVSNALSVNRPSPASGLAAMRRIVLAGSPRLQDLNVLVCESEYVLAMDVSERVATMGATVVGRASTPEEAAASHRLFTAALESQRSGQTVSLEV